MKAGSRALCTFATVATLAGCTMSHEMERVTPTTGHCPAESQLRAVDEPPDTLSLRWYRTAHDRDRELGASWCATVGEAVVRLTPATSGPAWRASEGLDVATWNTQIGGGDIFEFLRSEFGHDCTATRPPTARRPFVVLLQEVYRYSESLPAIEKDGGNVPWTIDPDREVGEDPDIVEVADRCGLAIVYVPSARNGADSGSRPHEDKGNAILSSVPLTTPIAIDLPHEGGRKVAIAATAYAPGGERVRLVTTHLDVASTLTRTLLTGNQTRVRQALGLVDGLRKAERDGPLTSVTLLGGDFNTWAGNEATLKFVALSFPESPEWDRLATRGAFPADHFFFRNGSFVNLTVDGYRRLDDSYASDHVGRRITLQWRAVEGG